MFVNYAHRGASTYYPENTLSSFYAGVFMGANGIETDVHRTKDGVLVLFHDDALDRVTDGHGPVSGCTYDELARLTVFNADYGRADKITTLEDFLRYFGWRDLTFAVELKQEGVEKETIDLLNRYRMRDKTILTSFTFENIARAREIDPGYKVGYLFGPKNTDDPVSRLRSIGGEQLCPRADMLTKEWVGEMHRLGFSVRAWGVKDEAMMAHAVLCGADGMTVNFPDKLHEYLNGQR